MQIRFQVGDVVAPNASPDRQGVIMTVLPPVAGSLRYRVFHGPDDIREYAEEQLIERRGHRPEDSWVQMLTGEHGLDITAFRARLTAARLANPLIDTLYALHSARITFIPFQFKPLLRLIRSDQPRLLIADEVGVGKTIEAGLILKELQSRQRLENILIVCPKALVTKWRTEMRRFDEDFRPLDGPALKYCFREAVADRAWPIEYSRAIAHLELLRIEEHLGGSIGKKQIVPGLRTLPPEVRFDLVIVDEAHHLRNPGTNSHELARFLCDASDAVLFLTATPVHIGATNLHALLALLRPDLFPNLQTFAATIEPNQYLFTAMRVIRASHQRPQWQTEVIANLEHAAATDWGRRVLSHDARFTGMLTLLRSGQPIADPERVRCLRDLEEIHSLAHVLNRTRRRDISQQFTQREPFTVLVPFNEPQRIFYQALIAFRRRILLLRYDQRVVRLLLDTLERQATSCLPALAATLEQFLHSRLLRLNTLTDTGEEEEFALPDELLEETETLLALARALPDADPKLNALDRLVSETLAGEGPGKLLVFSFFIHTLNYLLQRLRTAGVRVELITGRVADEDREHLRDRFRLPRSHSKAIDVLLSSEVGCEGLDYEFCDRLVNYDIPWNPMRIEQRIGRIDRFGQKSPKVKIFNFVTPDTVEERVFFRCFERLDIFRHTLGDLEAVLGDVVQQLTDVALDSNLTPAQAAERAQQLADNLVLAAEEQQRLEEESGSLLGLDDAFASDVHRMLESGRYVDPRDLYHLVANFVTGSEIGGRLSPHDPNATEHRLRLSRASRAVLAERVRHMRQDHDDRAARAFQQWLDGDEPDLALTFHQQTAVEQRSLPFITPVHVLARIAVAALRTENTPLVTRARVLAPELPVGRYLFSCRLWESQSIHPEVRLNIQACELETGEPVPALAPMLLTLLRDATPAATLALAEAPITTALEQLEAAAEHERRTELATLLERNENLIARRLASIEASYRSRSTRVSSELAVASDERIKRMKAGELARITDDYNRQRTAIESRRQADIYSSRIAAGILEVHHAK
ncbi:helicase [Oscillochloris trichoides DG-6]|uniref:Helicase n=1 Tax=Oscillochloris trichoides DG-6 TaxID=765420 RepID=E1IFI7_9CHLR|nr:SNF2-related protein [Oscillochloris trichoides]EFO80003.1 helicase [Oscillochloris trichoides DG-6]